ncbi:MAG: hypothetical protein Ct9H300mP6_17450 [Gammaproteobacteria bacterium]|nr:MAG: hypothetical protein Ct9H300mP6_17450 [Gammaproteobacteria bacterium]
MNKYSGDFPATLVSVNIGKTVEFIKDSIAVLKLIGWF